ncbi:MAG: Maf family protein [Synechococcales bacterium]|nr:Maf family protein [Synechococcales bacterium]
MTGKTAPKFVLASASPARRRLLIGAGIDPIVCPSQFDESTIQLNDPVELVQQLALGKVNAILEDLPRHLLKAGHHDVSRFDRMVILGCDSVLAIGGDIHGKPANAAEAIARWRQMRGQVGHLCTGHVLVAPQSQQTLIRCQVTEVYFAAVSDRQIEAYVATGEPLNCAGCFALEGRGSVFIEKIVGCHSNVIGLSLPLLRQMLAEVGVAIVDFWSP